jgi:hypothetical protein
MAMSQSPEKVFRVGRCSASVFKNMIEPKDGESGQKRPMRTVNLQRRYKDDDGEWKTSTSFGLGDLPCAVRVLELAQHYVESIEADTST